MYVAGWNMPGYLPETDPEYFEQASQAADWLCDTLERFEGHDLEGVGLAGGDSAEYRRIIDEYGYARQELRIGSTLEHVGQLAFWINETEAYGACGELGCIDCRPLFDADRNQLTDD